MKAKKMLIEVDGVSFSYPGGGKALDGVSLNLHPGEAAALVGRNGSGKSTLAKHLNGLLRPDVGRVRVGGWDTLAYRPAQLARRVAFTFQNPDEQLFRQTVWDEVAFGPQNLGFPPERVRELVDGALTALGLEAEARANPRDLGWSGRKRVALASALAMDAPVLVLDEPTAGLDAAEQALAAGVLAGLRRAGRTVVCITHDLDFAAENLERFILMEEGRIILDRPVGEFFAERGVLERAGLTRPQMVRLGERLGRNAPWLTVDDFLSNTGVSSGSRGN